jgi:hypothetical protein
MIDNTTTATTSYDATNWELPEGYFIRDNRLFRLVATEVILTDDAGNETAQTAFEDIHVHWCPIRVKSITKLPSGAVFEVESAAKLPPGTVFATDLAEFGGETETIYYDVRQLTRPNCEFLDHYAHKKPNSPRHNEELRGFFTDSIAWLHQKESGQPVT